MVMPVIRAVGTTHEVGLGPRMCVMSLTSWSTMSTSQKKEGKPSRFDLGIILVRNDSAGIFRGTREEFRCYPAIPPEATAAVTSAA